MSQRLLIERVLLGALLAGSGGCRVSSDSSSSGEPEPVRADRAILDPTPPEAMRVVPGELLVKLAPEAGERLDEALAAKPSAVATGLERLDALNARYGATRIEPVFAHRPDPEAIRRQYPERARRAPPGAQVPRLEHVYKLTLHPEADVRQAAEDYGAQPEIEYAHPNYLATVQ